MEVSFTDQGSGFPIVLIHGFCETGQIWNEFADDLSKTYRVLIPDLPGFGNSPFPDRDFRITDIAEIIYRWIRKLDIKETVIIGHSLGGYVTLALAENHPGILKGFGLFHSTALADSEEKRALRTKTIDFVRKQGAAVFANSFIPQLFHYKNRKSLSAAVNRVIRMAAEGSQQSIIAYTKAMRDRQDRTAVMKSFKQPILIIGGDEDNVLAIDDIRTLASLPGKPVVYIFENTGHMGMIEQKLLSVKVVSDFVDLCKAGDR